MEQRRFQSSRDSPADDIPVQVCHEIPDCVVARWQHSVDALVATLDTLEDFACYDELNSHPKTVLQADDFVVNGGVGVDFLIWIIVLAAKARSESDQFSVHEVNPGLFTD